MSTIDVLTGYCEADAAVLPLHTMRDGGCTCRRACASPAKHPLLGLAHGKNDPLRLTCRGECGKPGHGLYDATVDPAQVSKWIARYPGCNWGVRPPVGVVVIDVDPRNGGDVELARLGAAHGNLPPTLTARTGSGGFHYWLTYSGPTRGKLATGIDVKSNTGYVVVPPSLHEVGGIYEWTDNRPAAYAPQWVKDILNPPQKRRPPLVPGSGGGKGLIEFVARQPFGEINDSLYWASCRAAQAGILDDLADDLLRAAEHAAGGNASHAGQMQSRRTIESARKRTHDSPMAARPQAAATFLSGRSVAR